MCWRTTFQAKGAQIHASNFTGILPSPPGPCRQERKLSLLPASPLPRLQARGDFPHTKRSVPDSPMPRTPPMHREDSIPRVRHWVNQIHGSATRAYSCAGWSPFNGTRIDKADRWERPAYLNQSAWECSRSLGCVWEGASTNGLGTVGGLGVLFS